MIIFGRGRKIVAQAVYHDECPHCHQRNSVLMTVFARWFHLFWIPIFPYGKQGVAECANCRQTMSYKKMDPALQLTVQNMKSQARNPWWMYAGLVPIGVLVIFLFQDSQSAKKDDALYLAQPQKGDRMQLKLNDTAYTFAIVAAVSSDSVYLNPSEYEVRSTMGLHKLENEPYSQDTISYARASLQKLYEARTIMHIKRNYQ